MVAPHHSVIKPSASDNVSCLNGHKIDVLFGSWSNPYTCYGKKRKKSRIILHLSPAVPCVVQII